MVGLIIKDLLNLKKQARLMLIIVIFYALFGIYSGSVSMFGAMISLLGAMIPITAFSFDERAKRDKFALTMPVSRKDIVISKYLLGYLFTIGGGMLYLIYSFVLEKGGLSKVTQLTIGATIAAAILFLSIILPIVFKVGTEKARIYMMLIVIIPIAIGMFFSKLGINIKEPSEAFLKSLIYIIPIVVIIIAIISMQISIVIYSKKEL